MTKNTAILEEPILNMLLEPDGKPLLVASPLVPTEDVRRGTEEVATFLLQVQEQDYLKYELDGSVKQLEFVLDFIEQNRSYKLVIINDFQAFKTDPEKMGLLRRKPFDFLFVNLPALSKSNLEGAIAVIDYLSANKSEKMKATLAKKAQSGIKLGNLSFGDQRGKAVRTRKLNAFTERSMVPLRREAYRLVVEEEWSLNRVAQYFNETGKTSSKGGNFYAKTIDRLVEQQKELMGLEKPKESVNQDGFTPTHLRNPIKKGKASEIQLIVEGLNNDSYEEQISITLNDPLQCDLNILLHDNELGAAPVFQKLYSAGTKEIIIDLDEEVLLPGLHYISLYPQNKDIQPIENVPIALRKSLI